LPERDLRNLTIKARRDGSILRLWSVASLTEYTAGPAQFSVWNGRRAAVVAVESESDSGELYQTVQDQMPALVALLPKGAELHLLPGTAVGGAEALLIGGRLPDGSSEAQVHGIAASVSDALQGLADPKAARLIPAVLGLPTDEPAAFRLYVALCSRSERGWSSNEVAEHARAIFAAHPDVEFRINSPGVLRMPPLDRAPVVVGVTGPEDAALQVAEQVRDRLAKCEILSNLQVEYGRPVPQLEIELDGAKLIQLGLPQVEVVNTLEILLGRIHADRKLRGDGVHWLLRAAPAGPRVEDLANIKIRDKQGNLVRLGVVANIRSLTDIPYLRRIDGQRCMLLTAEPAPGVPQIEAQLRCRQIGQEVIDQTGMSKSYSVLQK
jgi:multidrug efflux pump subunit AcrB